MIRNSLKSIAVIGGGRWARVLIKALSAVVSDDTVVTIYSPHNAAAMSLWAAEQEFPQSLVVLPEFTSNHSCMADAVIVANAARDHEVAITKALDMGAAVLVEKPVTLSYRSTEYLKARASKKGVLLAPAHIFLFTSYLERFSVCVSSLKDIKAIHVDWMDPVAESRYGELKQYDQGLPIFFDWLPHVVSILLFITENSVIEFKSLVFSRGGSELDIELVLVGITCHICLTRNGRMRERIFTVHAERIVKLDFSTEPGVIDDGHSLMCADADWNDRKPPSEYMLSAFLGQSLGGQKDPRMDIATALQANKMIDKVATSYQQLLREWLVDRLSMPVVMDRDLHYALCELLFSESPFSVDVEMQVERICQAFNGVRGGFWHSQLIKSNEPLAVIRAAAVH